MIPRNLVITVILMLALALAMGIYAWQMRGRAAQSAIAAAATRPVAPPVSGSTEQVTLYVANDDAGTLRPQAASIPLPAGRQERAEELLRALLAIYSEKDSPHPLPPGAEIDAVYLVDPGLAVIDTNAVLADAHRSGILVEELTVASLVQTLSANISGINRVRILVAGKSRDSLAGHADLSDFYDVSQVAQMVSQLQTSP